ncbi:MAG: hypothetical protein NTX50_02005 [Candidatus Sumerlaeota bacterium]|nr:hypothetical protein [Candidatus Sumerlaeota bacterium]
MEPDSRQIHHAPRTMTNREFFESYARSGMVGLASGDTFIDRLIARAERHVTAEGEWGCWTHSFVIGERRCDGHLWIIESDLEIHRKHIQLGAQENRADKFFDDKYYGSLALLDFHLPEESATQVLAGGLDLVASRARYSLRELIGTLIALRHPSLRPKPNALARPESFDCSAFVRCLFLKAGIDLAPGMDIKNTTPEDLWRSPLAPETWTLIRAVPESLLARLKENARRGLRLRHLKRERKRRERSAD